MGLECRAGLGTISVVGCGEEDKNIGRVATLFESHLMCGSEIFLDSRHGLGWLVVTARLSRQGTCEAELNYSVYGYFENVR